MVPVLTARLQHETQTYFDQLRQQHFPPERNFVRAHLTLFHALPQVNRNAMMLRLHDITRRESPMEGWSFKLQLLGRGVAFVVDCPRLASLRASLAQLWHCELTAQDRQTPRLHITVQNKATPEAARALLDALNRDFKPRHLLFEGLDLWRYLGGGPWSLFVHEETDGRHSADDFPL
ncbi:MAG: 2'-5' RNA ligase family protein [Bryobacteraceae bacterium]